MRSLLLALAFGCGGAACAQFGLHVASEALYSAYTHEQGGGVMLGLGYQHDTSPRTAVSIDVLLALKTSDGTGRYAVRLNGAEGSAVYSVSPFLSELRFKSYYFIADNTEAAGYVAVSASLALHWASFDRDRNSADEPTDQFMPVAMKSTRAVVPLCFHIGIRGDLRYLYMDWYGWAGYQIGAVSQVPDGYAAFDAYSGKAISVAPPKLTYGMGLSLGYGSDGRKVK